MVMVPSIESALEGALFGRLGSVAAAVREKVRIQAQCVHPAACDSEQQPQHQQQEQHICRSFELADSLECGMGPGLASRYVEPRQTERRLLVKVSEDSQQHALMTESGHKLLIARQSGGGGSEGISVDIFVSCGNRKQAEALGPDFKLQSNAAKDRWSLHIARCEQCESKGKRQCGTRELGRFRHYCEAIGESEAFCMDVELPEYEEGSPGGRCQVCGACPVDRIHELTTRRPWWDEKHETLRLSFHGRCNVASERNFQLEAPGSERTAPVKLLFGERSHKINDSGKKLFALDYSEPLGTVQAFAAALSTMHWQ